MAINVISMVELEHLFVKSALVQGKWIASHVSKELVSLLRDTVLDLLIGADQLEKFTILPHVTLFETPV